MSEEIFDVVLQPTQTFEPNFADWESLPPPEEDFYLRDELWIGRLPYGLASDQVFDACGSPGFNFHPTRQYGYRYAFCRKVYPESSEYYAWDHDVALHITLFLSRLIHPTTIAPHHSARLYFHDGQLEQIVPGRTQGYATHVWVSGADDYRDWLSIAEAHRLKELLPLYQTQVPDRVRRARKHLAHVFHSFYLDQRTASLVTAYESLLKLDRYKATSQFKSRAPRLAELVGQVLTESEADMIYNDRSAFVHGNEGRWEDLSEELLQLYERFESVMRASLLRASTEKEFAQLFESPEQIRKNFDDAAAD